MTIKNYKNIKRSRPMISLLHEIIDLHDEMKGAYFWRPPSSAPQRRAYERDRSNFIKFSINNTLIEIDQKTDCSCKNIYYSLSVHVDGVKKNIRVLKNLVRNGAIK